MAETRLSVHVYSSLQYQTVQFLTKNVFMKLKHVKNQETDGYGKNE